MSIDLVYARKVCESCKLDRERAGMAPMVLIALPNPTLRKNITVHVCPDCDGGALELGIRG